LAIKHSLVQRGATVLALDDLTTDVLDKTAHSIAHGVIRLEELTPDYGAERRRLRVMKYRGQRFRGGYHDFIIKTGGIEVFPRLVSSEHRTKFSAAVLSSGIAEVDALLGGGLEKGSSALVLGPAGTGKYFTSLKLPFAAVRNWQCSSLTRNSVCCSADRRPWASIWKGFGRRANF
jgi:circadian clock protein KaiC